MENPPPELLDRFLHLLNIQKRKPDSILLNQITKSFLTKIPFETISKLYHKNKFNLRTIPDLKMYLDGIEKYNFGGTCYSNNFYLNLILKYLGYDVMLCGADMSAPDVHIVNIVAIDKHELLVDVGYGAPFLEPIPRDLDHDFTVLSGYDKYVLKPQDKIGNSQIEHYRNDKLIHGYLVKPIDRQIEFFNDAFTSSFWDESEFMNNISLSLYSTNQSVVLHNLTLVTTNKNDITLEKIDSRDELPEVIEKNFHIPSDIAKIALTELKSTTDSWG